MKMRRRPSMNRLLETCLFAAASLPHSVMGDTCLSQPQLAGVIFGSVGATLAICVTIATIFWMWMRRSDQKEKLTEKAAHDSKDFNDIESKTYDDIPPRPSARNHMSMIDSLKLPRRKLLDTGTQKAYSVENVNEASGHVGVLLKTDNAAGFGMNIQGSMNEGIYVKTIVPMGAADQTGNILPGDRIKSLTINFDNMVYEDALTLLSYASPYKVKFELERRVETPPPMDNDDTSGARIHPLFRSNTLTHIHFNPIGATQALSFENPTHQEPSPIVEEEPVTEAEEPPVYEKKGEKAHEPKSEEILSPINPPELVSSAVISEVADSTTIDTDLSKMESSDYASDNTSDYRESENEGCGNGNQPAKVDPAPPPPTPPPPSPPPPVQESVVDCTVITDLPVEKPLALTVPVSPKEYCKALPPKIKPSVVRSPSPKLKLALPKAPSPSPLAKSSMLRKSREDCSKPSQMIPPVKRNLSNGRVASARTSESSSGPPEIVEARVSRIPKRTDSVKTPIIERKLPPLPKSITQRSHSAEEKNREDVWSRLYTDKRNMLRKTRGDVTPKTPSSTDHEITTTTTPSHIPSSSGQLRPPTDFRFSSLDAAQKDRLAANEALLERQTEELRQLGVL
ncbi:hypothetical protein V3C99_015069 [Haemonchus contortus]